MIAKITHAQLVDADACPEQLDIFLALFPSSEVIVTEELAATHLDVFEWDWAAERLLSKQGYVAYMTAVATAYRKYLKVRMQLHAAKPGEDTTTLWEITVIELQESKAIAFARNYLKDNL